MLKEAEAAAEVENILIQETTDESENLIMNIKRVNYFIAKKSYYYKL